jgi:CRISPR-associated protein Cmr1
MNNIIFNCEVITPMFLAGADGQTPELRAPSIKGALRFWWRAMNGHLPLKEMQSQEGKIFGSTDYGRSKVLIRVEEDMEWNGRSDASPTPHKPRFSKNAFRAGQHFSIILSLFDDVDLGLNEKFILEDLRNLFLLTATFGGIGGRVRRGFGAFNIIKINDKNEPQKQPKTTNEINELLSNEYFKIVDKKIVSIKQLNNRYPYIKEIEIGSPNDDVLKKIGNTTHDVKGIDSYDYETALGHASRGRFASPIYVSVIKTAKGLCPIIVTLNTAPENDKQVNYKLQNTFKTKIL